MVDTLPTRLPGKEPLGLRGVKSLSDLALFLLRPSAIALFGMLRQRQRQRKRQNSVSSPSCSLPAMLFGPPLGRAELGGVIFLRPQQPLIQVALSPAQPAISVRNGVVS